MSYYYKECHCLFDDDFIKIMLGDVESWQKKKDLLLNRNRNNSVDKKKKVTLNRN